MERCSNCNNLNKAQSKYCTSCGANLENQSLECPECGSQNKTGASFCTSCGRDLKSGAARPTEKTRTLEKTVKTKNRSSGLKIFLTVIFSIMGVAIIVLSGLYFFGGFFGTEVTVEENIAETYEPLKEKLSSDQTRLLSMYGYPDEFVILFSDGEEFLRIESWIYEAMESCFTFENGEYIEWNRMIVENLSSDKHNIKPEDFVYAMSPDNIRDLMGEKGDENIDPETGLKVLVFGEKQLICVFDYDDALITVTKLKEVESYE